ncbi:F-box/LRR-repeat protein 2 [Hypsizygus marmoreus]|uniref:F-box/LRR-repeat protein 2 n=1 Tax=Hypsizygus marmoreus TaxID=39966 RepID=A0A369K7C1_HYPMA|nr:F-box/LRR-repeat protein 2 [Hypsizygus marmoreus]
MSHTHDIDNEEHLFQFDTCENASLSNSTAFATSIMSSHDVTPTSEEHYEPEDGILDGRGKGKGVTKPMPIRIPVAAAHDLFDMTTSGSMVSSTSCNSHRSMILTPLTPSSLYHYSTSLNLSQRNIVSSITQGLEGSTVVASPSNDDSMWKGKEKELSPVLPPLTFSRTEFAYPQLSNPSPPPTLLSPGPSSYASSIGLPTTCTPTNVNQSETGTFETDPFYVREPSPAHIHESTTPILKRVPSRRRSLSALSEHSTRSLAARSMTRIKLKLRSSRTPGSLARKLLFRKPTEPEVVRPEFSTPRTFSVADAINSPDPWRTTLKVDELDSSIARLSNIRLQDTNAQVYNTFHYTATPLRHKGRSNSSPFPLSALDYIPVTSTDIFTPIPITVKNYFDDILPRELRLQVLAALVALHQVDHHRTVKECRWNVSKASSHRSKWVGKEKGFRELVRLSRVSKTWQALVFDGQLWTDLHLRSFPHMPESLLLRLTATGGPFTTTMDVAGHAHISSSTLLEITDNLCVTNGYDPAYTQLTAINLQGCSSLTTRSLHELLLRSRSLQKLCVKGLSAVTNATCKVLSACCPGLISLDMSRCLNMDAEGIRTMAFAANARGEYLQLKELRLCGLKYVNDAMMAALGQAAPYLEVLDLSYARQLHNSSLEAFVACGVEETGHDSVLATIVVTPGALGRELTDATKFRRRITRLRHLSMSFCLLLTDEACSNLAHSVPHLEFLEMAGIGADLKDEGLVRLLNTTPYIRRLDLEDALEITDSVLATLTPSISDKPPLANAAPEPGHALEQLNVSYASNITDDALLSLIRSCKRLKWLEADNTRIGGAVVKEFVQLCKARQMADAKVVVVDCRGVPESFVKELAPSTRPRMGRRVHEARKLYYLDARDGNVDELKVGQDECDEKRVVLKSFYSWQTVDAVKAAREKRRKGSSRRANNESSGSGSGLDLDGGLRRGMRWWSPGSGRRSPRSGRSSPLNIADLNSDGCRIM